MRFFKGQGSIEYLALFTITLLILIPLFFSATDLLSDRQESVSTDRLRASVESLGNAINFMCLQPEGSEREVSFSIPPQVDLSQSFIGNESVSNTTIKFALRTGDSIEIIDIATSCAVNSTMPANSGDYFFHLKRHSKTSDIKVEVCYRQFVSGTCG